MTPEVARVWPLPSSSCTYAYAEVGVGEARGRWCVSSIAGLIPAYGARQMTYDLRRLRRKGFIQRIPRTQRYELTSEGRRLAVFFTKTYTRILNPSLAQLDPTLLPKSPLDHPSPPPRAPSNAHSST